MKEKPGANGSYLSIIQLPVFLSQAIHSFYLLLLLLALDTAAGNAGYNLLRQEDIKQEGR